MRFSRLAVLVACTVGTVACYLAIPTSGATFQNHKTGTITITVVIPSATATRRPVSDPSSATSGPVALHGQIQTPTGSDETKATTPSPDPKDTPTDAPKPAATTTSPSVETTASPITTKGGASDAPTP